MGGWGEVYPCFFWNFFNFAKPLSGTAAILCVAACALGCNLCYCRIRESPRMTDPLV